MGKTLIEWIYYRLRFCQELNQIILATADTPENDILAGHAQAIDLAVFRGSEQDLISRLLGAAKEFNADAVVRITGDCPLVDVQLVDNLAAVWREKPSLEYVCNIFPPTFPDGLDIEVISRAALERLDREIKDELHREWLTTNFLENPTQFKIKNISSEDNLSQWRLTVDYPEDFELAEKIFEKLHQPGQIFGLKEILALFKEEPVLPAINEKWVDKDILKNIRSAEFHQLKNNN